MKKKAKEIIVRMQTKLQIPWLRTLAWAFRKIWRSIYQQLEVNEQILLKMNDALKKGPVLLIPSHRSYIDFLILSYVLFAFNLPVPLIASGEVRTIPKLAGNRASYLRGYLNVIAGLSESVIRLERAPLCWSVLLAPNVPR